MTLLNYSTPYCAYEGYGSSVSGYGNYYSSSYQNRFTSTKKNSLVRDISSTYGSDIDKIVSLINQGEYEAAFKKREEFGVV